MSRKHFAWNHRKAWLNGENGGITSNISIQLEDARGKALDMFTYISVNDSLTLQTSLDSGAGHHVFRINSKFMPVLGIDSVAIDKSYKKGSFDRKKGNMFYKTTLDKMTLQSSPKNGIEDFKVTFVKGLVYDAIVPVQWLGNRVTINIARKEMIVP